MGIFLCSLNDCNMPPLKPILPDHAFNEEPFLAFQSLAELAGQHLDLLSCHCTWPAVQGDSNQRYCEAQQTSKHPTKTTVGPAKCQVPSR